MDVQFSVAIQPFWQIKDRCEYAGTVQTFKFWLLSFENIPVKKVIEILDLQFLKTNQTIVINIGWRKFLNRFFRIKIKNIKIAIYLSTKDFKFTRIFRLNVNLINEISEFEAIKIPRNNNHDECECIKHSPSK